MFAPPLSLTTCKAPKGASEHAGQIEKCAGTKPVTSPFHYLRYYTHSWGTSSRAVIRTSHAHKGKKWSWRLRPSMHQSAESAVAALPHAPFEGKSIHDALFSRSLAMERKEKKAAMMVVVTRGQSTQSLEAVPSWSFGSQGQTFVP